MSSAYYQQMLDKAREENLKRLKELEQKEKEREKQQLQKELQRTRQNTTTTTTKSHQQNSALKQEVIPKPEPNIPVHHVPKKEKQKPKFQSGFKALLAQAKQITEDDLRLSNIETERLRMIDEERKKAYERVREEEQESKRGNSTTGGGLKTKVNSSGTVDTKSKDQRDRGRDTSTTKSTSVVEERRRKLVLERTRVEKELLRLEKEQIRLEKERTRIDRELSELDKEERERALSKEKEPMFKKVVSIPVSFLSPSTFKVGDKYTAPKRSNSSEEMGGYKHAEKEKEKGLKRSLSLEDYSDVKRVKREEKDRDRQRERERASTSPPKKRPPTYEEPKKRSDEDRKKPTIDTKDKRRKSSETNTTTSSDDSTPIHPNPYLQDFTVPLSVHDVLPRKRYIEASYSDDEEDDVMEAKWSDIVREEERSKRIAKKEDEEEERKERERERRKKEKSKKAK